MSGTNVQQAPKVISELKVSGNLMTLDSGLFCIFHSPGAVMPDATTGLPCVRVSLPPNAVAGAAVISTFNAEGWLDPSGAALVRVGPSPAQVLVTVYQDANGRHDAPKLQVLRLVEGQAAAPAPPQPPRAAAQQPAPGIDPATAEMGAHVQVRGDILGRIGEWIGDRASQRWMEGFVIAPKQHVAPADIEYQAVLGRDWMSPWAEGGQFCGSRGMSLPILGLRVRLRGAAAERFGLALSATFTDGTAVGPIQNGGLCQADSFAPLEAFQVVLTDRSARAAQLAAPAAPAASPARPSPKAKPAAKPAPARPSPAGKAPAGKAPGKPPARRR